MGRGRALARHRWMDVDDPVSVRASDSSVPLRGSACVLPNRFTGSTSGDAKPSPCSDVARPVHLDWQMLLPLDALTFPGPSGTARR